MKRGIKTFIIAVATAAMCSCGEDRSQEFYELTKENQWTYNAMKEAYLWADSIKPVSQRTYFSTPAKFFASLLYKGDGTSFFEDFSGAATYGFRFSLMRDPLGIAPAKVYALVEYVEPSSVAAAAGLQRGMWITAINGNSINMGTGSALTSGDAIMLTVNQITYNDDSEEYAWEQLPYIALPAATEISPSPLPVTTIISDNAGKTGYILCNSFDGETTVENIYNTLAAFDAEGVTSIVLDLRYFSGNSITNAAAVAAAFVPAGKQGTTFCSLYKNLELTSKENISYPSATINSSDKPLYIVTTAKTTGTASTFIKAVRIARGTSQLRIVGQTANGTNIATESIESPYQFKINPATAIIADSNGEPITAITPDFILSETDDYKHIYPLGSKQEFILYNISYIIANGTLPAAL